MIDLKREGEVFVLQMDDGENRFRPDSIAGWNACLETCALRDVNPSPPDGTWQSYLKIDGYRNDDSFNIRQHCYNL